MNRPLQHRVARTGPARLWTAAAVAAALVAVAAAPAAAATTGYAWDDGFAAATGTALGPSPMVPGAPSALALDPSSGALLVGTLSGGTGSLARFAADGTPDPAFAAAIPSLDGAVGAITVDAATGAITVAGGVGGSASSTGWLARFGADGTPDTAFAAALDGAVDGPVLALVVDEQSGAMTVGGDFGAPGWRLARFAADGTPDTAFNAAVGSTLGGGGGLHAIAVDGTSGAVVVGGVFSPVGASTGPLARFAADGTPDVAFNAAVGATLDGEVYAVAVDEASGAVTVGGNFTSQGPGLTRFAADGTPDAAFNAAVSGTVDGPVFSMVTDGQGRVTVGWFDLLPGQAPQAMLARFAADGTPDAAFNAAVDDALNAIVTTIAADGTTGAVTVGGGFTTPGAYLARISPVTVAVQPLADRTSWVGTTVDPVTLQATTTGGPVTWSATGLPAGLALDAVTGVISGTPTTSGSTVVQVGATSSGITDTATFAWDVVEGPPPTITGTLPDGVVGQPYDAALSVTGTPAPTVEVVGGSLPDGLVLDPSGRLHGTPTTAGTSTVDLRATNTVGAAELTDVVVEITAPDSPVDPTTPDDPGTAAGTGAGTGGSGTLAVTGTDPGALAGLVAALLAGGGLIVGLRHRFRTV